jgi:hypothetical protein
MTDREARTPYCLTGQNPGRCPDRFSFLRSLPGACVFVQEYLPMLVGPSADIDDFFGNDPDKWIDELIRIVFTQNMKSMERYYRWVSRRYAETYGKLHTGLVGTIFRYNKRHKKGGYIATLAGTKKGKCRLCKKDYFKKFPALSRQQSVVPTC